MILKFKKLCLQGWMEIVVLIHVYSDALRFSRLFELSEENRGSINIEINMR